MSVEIKAIVTCDRCKEKREEPREFNSSIITLSVNGEVTGQEDLCDQCVSQFRSAMEMPAKMRNRLTNREDS